jgi:predicted transposase YdaD
MRFCSTMPAKDIISKQLLKRMSLGMARVLLGLDLSELDIVETAQQRVEERRADFVAKVKAQAGDYLLHIEIQNENQSAMPWRMLRYLTDIKLAYPGLPVRQYLIYIGRDKLRMAAGIEEANHNYQYHMLDMHGIDCENLLQQDTPEALIFAILADFGAADAREIVQRIVLRLQALTASNETVFRDYFLMLEVLSDNRDLKQILKEAEKMLSHIKYSDLPSYELGWEYGKQEGLEEGIEKGKQEGILQGEVLMLQNQLRLKFGNLPDSIMQRLQTADSAELLYWSERILSADSLAEIFTEH